jgi:hypothetical protein
LAASNGNIKKVLTSRGEIMEYANLSKYLFAKFVKMGMPVLYIDGRCYAHKDNIDEFFKAITRVNSSKIADDILDAEEPTSG